MTKAITCPFEAEGGVCEEFTCGIYSDEKGKCSVLVIAESLAILTEAVSYYTSLFGPRGFEKELDPVLDVAGPDPSNLADYDASKD